MKLFRPFVLALACLAGGVAVAQDYPAKPIRLLIPAAPGGGVDSAGRILATRLSATLGKPVVPENRAGAGTMIASEMLAQSPPDGYTILLATSSHTVNAALRKSLRFDPIGDFAAVSQVGYTPDFLVVNPRSGIKSVADLVAAAKRTPGKMTFGSSGPATLSQLEPELLKKAAGIDILHVPYKGGVPAVTALMGNEVDMLFLGTVALAPFVKAGKLRPIAVTGKTRSPLFPDVPTMAESGFPDWDTGTWYGVVVPARTPPAIVATLNKQIHDALKLPDVRDKLAATGIEPTATTADQFYSLMKTDIARWKKVAETLPQLKVDE
ncbi:Tripartite-type tricarboxylate transporter, receptor component TctC [Cupriavidus sp. YR651]|uniref:Bug family tripartite tricarboxylate transporter substrate binding protein n=1 Tax=Cupriavidus sp. YR651 TaxID=1855315 RepID=UPI0008873B77|nr:tripartite tricarboxylate transporter substrate binding protein [Cupriavidus sp. YR651]SDD93626.1 Tripartite-type tricarboxylate transporter, receptor component TctC [Cupriavidus sp. YR651]